MKYNSSEIKSLIPFLKKHISIIDEDLNNKKRESIQFMGEAHSKSSKQFNKILTLIIETMKRREDYKNLLKGKIQNIEQSLVNINEKNQLSILLFLDMLADDFSYLPEENTNWAMEWLTLYLDILETAGDNNLLGKAYYTMGVLIQSHTYRDAFDDNTNYDTMFIYYQKALVAWKSVNDYKNAILVLENIFKGIYRLKDEELTKKLYFEYLDYAILTKDKKKIGRAQEYIGEF